MNFETYGWTCPKCGRVYSPTQSMCLYCGPRISELTDINGNTALSEEELKKCTNTTNSFKYKIDCDSIDYNEVPSMYYNSTSISCSAYRNEECLATKEPFITSCKGEKEKCENEYGPC